MSKILFKLSVYAYALYTTNMHRRPCIEEGQEKMLKTLPLSYKIMGDFYSYSFHNLIIIVYLPSVICISFLWICFMSVTRKEQ